MGGYWNTPRLGPSLPPPSSPRLRRSSNQYRHRRSLGLEDCSLDVTEVFAVGVERKRDVAADLDPVEVVLADEAAIVSPTAQNTGGHRRQRKRCDLDRRDEIEAPTELRLARDRQR